MWLLQYNVHQNTVLIGCKDWERTALHARVYNLFSVAHPWRGCHDVLYFIPIKMDEVGVLQY